MEIGYARVSTDKQHEDRQLFALQSLGIPDSGIYVDKQSGKDFARPQYQQMLERLRPGDVLYIKSIDRLGRNYDEILEQWRTLTKKMDVDIVVLDMPLLDTRKGKDLIGTLISDIVLQLLSYVAHQERESISQRTKEGLARRRAAGVVLGRPKGALGKHTKLSGKEDVIRCLLDCGNSYAATARALKVDRSTLVRFCDARGLRRAEKGGINCNVADAS